MLKNSVAIVLLIMHVNFSMFIAQVDEVNTYDKNGRQQEDINSMVQYIAEVFHLKHKPLPDADDNNARYFHVVKSNDYFSTQQIVAKENIFNVVETTFPLFIEKKTNSVLIDFQGPPPKA